MFNNPTRQRGSAAARQRGSAAARQLLIFFCGSPFLIYLVDMLPLTNLTVDLVYRLQYMSILMCRFRLNSLFISIDNKVSLYFLVLLFKIEGDDNTRVQSMVTPNWILLCVATAYKEYLCIIIM
jgi:hypothetical protein